jgi:hypothetical protein
MGSEMAAAAKEAYALEEAMQDLEDRQTAQIVVNAQAEAQVNRLLLQAKNRTLSERERLAILDRASKIEKDNFEQNKKLAQDAYDNELSKYALKTKLSKAELEELMTNTSKRAEIEGKASQLSGEEIKRLAELRAGIIKQESESINLQEKIQNRRDALLDAAAAKEKSRQEALQKQKEAFAKDNEERYQERVNLNQKQNEDLLKAFEDELKAIQDTAKVEADVYSWKSKQKKKFDDADIQSSVAVANAAKGVISELASAAQQGSDLQKALALTNVAINLGTAIGNLTATTSAASPDNLATGGIAGFVKYAAGLAQIIGAITSARNIIGGAAAGGGDFMTNGPTMLLVGDNPGGRERVTVEPISGKGQTTINPNSGLVAMAGGGTLTTSGYGGFAERNSGLKTMIDYNLLAKAIAKQPAPILQLSELNKKQSDLEVVQKKINLSV